MANTYRGIGRNLTTANPTTIYTCPANTVAIIMKINCANVMAIDTNVSVMWTDISSTPHATIYLCKNTVLPTKTAIKVGDEEPVILMAGNSLQAQTDDAGGVDVTLAILEIS